MAKIIAGTGVVVDPNSWELTIYVTDLQAEHTLRVYGAWVLVVTCCLITKWLYLR